MIPFGSLKISWAHAVRSGTLYDLARKRLVWSGEGRTTDTLNAFFDFLGPEKTAALAGICCDMWQPYIDVIKDRAGQAVLVFDKFHIVSHLMKAVVYG